MRLLLHSIESFGTCGTFERPVLSVTGCMSLEMLYAAKAALTFRAHESTAFVLLCDGGTAPLPLVARSRRRVCFKFHLGHTVGSGIKQLRWGTEGMDSSHWTAAIEVIFNVLLDNLERLDPYQWFSSLRSGRIKALLQAKKDEIRMTGQMTCGWCHPRLRPKVEDLRGIGEPS